MVYRADDALARSAARAAAEAFGGKPSAQLYYDEPEEHSLVIVTCTDAPTPGYSSYSTAGLCAAPNLLDGRNVPVELAAVGETGPDDLLQGALATAGFCVVKDGWLCAPGVVFPSLLRRHPGHMEHVVWMPPFEWDLGPVAITPTLEAHWLLAVPISEGEYQFLLERGFDEFEDMLAESEVEYFDLDRPPLVSPRATRTAERRTSRPHRLSRGWNRGR